MSKKRYADDDLLSTTDVARLRGVNRMTVHFWITRHGLPFTLDRWGRRLIRYADAIAFQRRHPGPKAAS